MTIDARGKLYRLLNEEIRALVRQGVPEIVVENVLGHRYIGCGVSGQTRIVLRGVAGNDLAAFMNGPTIVVEGNAQEGVGNTMNAGKVIVRGDAGDILGHSLRGGKIFVKGNVGFRTGIHMKSYQDRFPVVVVGGRAQEYLGEYMAGGILVLLGLGLTNGYSLTGNYVGTGMHGGRIFLRGRIDPYQLGQEVKQGPLCPEDWDALAPVLSEYVKDLDLGDLSFKPEEFVVLTAATTRPYGNLYVY